MTLNEQIKLTMDIIKMARIGAKLDEDGKLEESLEIAERCAVNTARLKIYGHQSPYLDQMDDAIHKIIEGLQVRIAQQTLN